MRFCWLNLVAMNCVIVGLTAVAAEGADLPLVQTIRTPDGGLEPQCRIDHRGRLHLIYFKGDPNHGDILYVRSDDAGATFSRPIRVNSQPASAMVIGSVRGPHLALGKDDRVHVAWMGSNLAEPKVSGKFTPMLYARLNDAGDGFEAQRNIIRDWPGLDGGGAVAADSEGNVYVAWHSPRSGHDEADRRVWIATSRDDGRTFAPEIEAIRENVGACGCCGLDMAAGTNGDVFILFRSAKQIVHRDMILLASTDHAATFHMLRADPWRSETCVMSTPAFGRFADDLWAAWETQGQIHIAPAQFGRPVPLIIPQGAGNRKHPAIAVNRQGDFVVAWTEDTGWNKGGAIGWQVFHKNGTPVGPLGRVDGLPAWDTPAAFVGTDDAFRIIF